MGRRDRPAGDQHDYFYDPEADKKLTVTEKSRRERGKDVERDKQKTRKFHIISYFILLGLAVICNIIALASIGWYTWYGEQETIAVDGEKLTRRIDFGMSYEGLKIYIDYVDESGSDAVLEADQYLKFSDATAWPDNYAGPIGDCATFGLLLLLCSIFCILCLMVAGIINGLGLYLVNKIKRKPYLIGFYGAFVGSCATTASVVLFILKTSDFRALLKAESVAKDTEPDLVPSYSLWIVLVAVGTSFGSLYPYYQAMPPADDTTAEEALTAKQKERERRIKQYLDDVTNDTYIREHWTIMPTPVSRDGRQKLPPIQGAKPESPPAGDDPMMAPGAMLTPPKLGDHGEMDNLEQNTLPGAIPDNAVRPFSDRDYNLPPPSSPLYGMRKELIEANGARRQATKHGGSILLPTITDESRIAAPPEASDISNETVIEAFQFRLEEGSNQVVEEEAKIRPMTRERPVTRAPPQDRRQAASRKDLEVVVVQP